MKRKSTVLIYCFVMIAIACKEKDEITKLTQSNDLCIIDGRAYFENENLLEEFMKYAIKSDFNDEYIELIIASERQGFNSLKSPYDIERKDQILKVLERKKEEKGSITGGNLREDYEYEEEDELIADPFFASVLNDRREIHLGENIYKYTLDGLYFTNYDNIQALYDYLERKSRESNGRVNIDSSREIVMVDDNVFLIPSDPILEDGSGGSGGSGGSTSTDQDESYFFDSPEILALSFCGELKKNIFTSAFGPKVECIRKISDDLRVKTQAWNQNYFLYSSLGVSVKSSEKTLGIWWSKAIDKLELGIGHASFKYPSVNIQWPNPDYKYFYLSPEGYMLDQYGRAANPKALHPANYFSSFPITNPDMRFFVILTNDDFLKGILPACSSTNSAWDECSIFEITGKDINKQMKTVVKNVFTYSRKALEGKPKMVVEMPENALSMSYFDYTDSKSNDNSLRKIFDWNTAQISITLNAKDNYSSPNIGIKTTAKSYKQFYLTGYGRGREGSTWAGNRILFEDEN